MTESDEAPVSPTGMPHIAAPSTRRRDRRLAAGGDLRRDGRPGQQHRADRRCGGGSASAHTVVLSGVAGLLAGAFSMALGEYTSVTTANEQIDSEVRVERRALQ